MSWVDRKRGKPFSVYHDTMRHYRVLVWLILSGVGCVLVPLASAQTNFQKLPLSINTPNQSELLPVISADGKTLYFTRTRSGIDSSTVFDIWLSHVTNDSVFSPPEFVGGNLASSYGIAVSSISPDNNTLYLIGKTKSDSPPDERLYVAHKTSYGWSIPEAIKIQNLHPHGLYTDYSFGPDQRTLLMAIDRDSSLGDRDLYVSFFRRFTRSWKTPLWLGADINSRFAEMTPNLASDNKTIYFSSDRPGGIGDVDVYRSRRLDDTWQHWSMPENLGSNVNRAGRTSYYAWGRRFRGQICIHRLETYRRRSKRYLSRESGTRSRCCAGAWYRYRWER